MLSAFDIRGSRQLPHTRPFYAELAKFSLPKAGLSPLSRCVYLTVDWNLTVSNVIPTPSRWENCSIQTALKRANWNLLLFLWTRNERFGKGWENRGLPTVRRARDRPSYQRIQGKAPSTSRDKRGLVKAELMVLFGPLGPVTGQQAESR